MDDIKLRCSADSAVQALPNSRTPLTDTDPITPWREHDARQNPLVTVMKARSTFILLQVLDLLTTLAAFHVGAFEVNPLVARLTAEFGRVGGVVCSKAVAVLIALGVRRRLWMVNVFYTGVVIWNIFVLIALWARQH